MNSILKLNKRSKYDYIQDNCFSNEGSNLAYIFKMYIIGHGSGFDLVKRMQPSGNLEL